MRDGFLGFIAHVGETKGFAFDLPVTAVDDEMMFFTQVANEFRHVDFPIIFHAGESKRAKIFFGKKFETSPGHPVVNERIGASVTSKTRRQSFSKKDRKSTRLNSSHVAISYAVFCLKKK